MLLKSNQIEITKYLAIFLMFLDHYATINYDPYNYLKIIGRIVFPLFSFILIYNYIYNTSNKINYIKRLLIFALISQPFYYFAFKDIFINNMHLNIFFSLFLGLSIIYINETILISKKTYEKIFSNIIILVFATILSYWFSYGILGILLILTTYLYIKNNNIIYLSLLILNIYLLNILWSPLFSLVGIVSLILIYLISKIEFNIKRINKWFFYLFYPIHLLILMFI